ncbi:hypothetical protein DYI37_07460 [Fulvimarina endophytica]|uniref:Excalibur calcium-binding domain-containing protein n=1 Tax=Fulvimarina endophytica TaxID=2293836 RepID=A0A371X4M6_9HYPH|nr:excalibur calcium-binding domain-containing protein [Fulvimarina endophytica]RFC64181.1 hypothetical protein DYI37_07460 [Fulvimarina endophytica]
MSRSSLPRTGARTAVLAVVILANAAPAFAARCTDYANCRQAVTAWCAGQHNRADGDNDGIPCENVCSSRQQVVEIMQEIGCDR